MSVDSQKHRSTKLNNWVIGLLAALVAIGAYVLIGMRAGSHIQ